jgi:hypothetical protein
MAFLAWLVKSERRLRTIYTKVVVESLAGIYLQDNPDPYRSQLL